MIGVLRKQHPSPEHFYSTCAKTTTRAHEDMVAFENLMKDPRSQAILDQAQKSRREISDGITVWTVMDHPNWLDVQKETYSAYTYLVYEFYIFLYFYKKLFFLA